MGIGTPSTDTSISRYIDSMWDIVLNVHNNMDDINTVAAAVLDFEASVNVWTAQNTFNIAIICAAVPTLDTHLTNKLYVDAQIPTVGDGGLTTNDFTNADHSKLDGIEASATADQTAGEIKTAYEANADTNAFTDADHSKLDAIEASATADQTGAQIKTAYESEADTNAFDDAAVSKLAAIEASATADQTGAQIKTAYENESDTNAFTDADHTKLDGIEASATADQTDEEIQDIVGGMLTGNTETGITVTYEDGDGTLDFVVASQTDENFTTADHSKLDGIDASANNYTHPSGDGNVHVAADGGTNTGKVLTASGSAGVHTWETPSGGLDKWVSATTYVTDDVVWVAATNSVWVNVTGNSDVTFTASKWQRLSESEVDNISGATYTTQNELNTLQGSVGALSGGAITDDGDGTITVAAGTGVIRATNSNTATLLTFDYPASTPANVIVANGNTVYVYIEYNAGSPRAVTDTSKRTDSNTNILLGVVYRNGLTIHFTAPIKDDMNNFSKAMLERVRDTQPFMHASGAAISEVGTNQLAWTAGEFWLDLTKVATQVGNTTGTAATNNSFEYFYYDGANWQTVDQTIAAVAFTGSGLNDATSGGSFVGGHTLRINVVVDSVGGTDTFKWNYLDEDGVTVVETTGVAMTGGAQTLRDGVTITFAATTGHTDTDAWAIDCELTHTIDNTQYNNIASGLSALTAGQYGIHWVYMDLHGHVSVLFGQASYIIDDANAATPPAALPVEFLHHTRLIGKVVILKSASSFQSIENNYDASFGGSVATDHANLTNIGSNSHATIDSFITAQTGHLHTIGDVSGVVPAAQIIVAVNNASAGNGFGGFRYTTADGGATLNLFTT